MNAAELLDRYEPGFGGPDPAAGLAWTDGKAAGLLQCAPGASDGAVPAAEDQTKSVDGPTVTPARADQRAGADLSRRGCTLGTDVGS
jgi:hypothetical protein